MDIIIFTIIPRALQVDGTWIRKYPSRKSNLLKDIIVYCIYGPQTFFPQTTSPYLVAQKGLDQKYHLTLENNSLKRGDILQKWGKFGCFFFSKNIFFGNSMKILKNQFFEEKKHRKFPENLFFCYILKQFSLDFEEDIFRGKTQ